MPLTRYQLMIQKHLEYLLGKGDLRVSEVIISEEEREFVSDICAASNYCAVFSPARDGFISFIAIKLSDPC